MAFPVNSNLRIALEGWEELNQEIWVGIDRHIEELAGSVDLPAELLAHEEAAAQDEGFAESFDQWLGYVQTHNLQMAVEQSCDMQGLLLPADQRALRLIFVPDEIQFALSVFVQRCPRHVRALLTREVYWLVRFERIHRTGWPELRRWPHDGDATTCNALYELGR